MVTTKYSSFIKTSTRCEGTNNIENIIVSSTIKLLCVLVTFTLEWLRMCVVCTVNTKYSHHMCMFSLSFIFSQTHTSRKITSKHSHFQKCCLNEFGRGPKRKRRTSDWTSCSKWIWWKFFIAWILWNGFFHHRILHFVQFFHFNQHLHFNLNNQKKWI